MTTTCLIILTGATHEPRSNNTSHLNWKVQAELYYPTCIRYQRSYKTTLSTHQPKTGLQEQTEITCNSIFCSFLTQSSQENSGDSALGLLKRTEAYTKMWLLMQGSLIKNEDMQRQES